MRFVTKPSGWAILGLLCLLAAAVPSARADNILVNGNFADEPYNNDGLPGYGATGATALTGSQIPGWTIAPGTAATVQENGYFPVIPGSQYSVNTDGEGYDGHNTVMYQDFSSTAGTTYQFQFEWEWWYNDAPSSELQVSIFDTTTGAVLFDGYYAVNTVASLTAQLVSTTFIGTGDTLELEIQQTPPSGINDNQFIVGDFSVTPLVSTPEPSSLTLLGIGACVLMGYGWKRRKANHRMP